MKNVDYESVVADPYSRGAYLRSDFPGFREDYLVLHCLIRKHDPQTFMEIGTSSGLGTLVICKAMGISRLSMNKRKVYSIDVLPGTDPTILYPGGEDGHPARAGERCAYPYAQLFGDSYTLDFLPYYPLEGWFIDGKHSYDYVVHDTQSALEASPILIVWHDMQIEQVERAVVDVMSEYLQSYSLCRAVSTRMAFASRKQDGDG